MSTELIPLGDHLEVLGQSNVWELKAFSVLGAVFSVIVTIFLVVGTFAGPLDREFTQSLSIL